MFSPIHNQTEYWTQIEGHFIAFSREAQYLYRNIVFISSLFQSMIVELWKSFWIRKNLKLVTNACLTRSKSVSSTYMRLACDTHGKSNWIHVCFAIKRIIRQSVLISSGKEEREREIVSEWERERKRDQYEENDWI